MKLLYHSFLMLILLIFPNFTFSQEIEDSTDQQLVDIKKIIEGSKVSTQIFLGYRYYEEGNNHYNEFSIKRGYITFQKALNEHLSGRITPDITIDKEGDGEGDLEMRLKYCYMELKDKGDYWIFTDPKLLIGEVFTPWVEFEEKINHYRVQGSHFMEKFGIISSADFGVITTALLGGKINESYQKHVSNSYPGKYGSFSFGVYNGGGYHALEKNNNKTIQWRLSLRPFPSIIPGMQISYTGAYGKGNTNLYPAWNLHAGIISYESKILTIAGQYFNTLGNYEGSMADANGNSYRSDGYSIFTELKFFNKKVSLLGRYDYMSTNEITRKVKSTQEIIGIAYHIYEKNKIVLDFNRNTVDGNCDGIVEVMVELAL